MLKSAKKLGKSAFQSGGGMTSRTLLAALLIGAMPVYADNLSTPTLDKLKGQPIPDTDPVLYYPESAYTLTEVPSGADGSAPTGHNIITKFTYNTATEEFTPVYYEVALKQTEYGDPNGDVTLTFGWQEITDEWGDKYYQFIPDPADPIGETITYKYTSSTYTPETGNYTTEYINQVEPVEFTNVGDHYNYYQHTGGVQNVTNFENVLFKDNNTDVTLNVQGDGTTNYWGSVEVKGGALNNSDTIDTISGAFINNSITTTTNENTSHDIGNIYAYGGALYNNGNIIHLNADFINNSLSGTRADGGAIFNDGEIGEINGNFIENTAGNYGSGGAIYNEENGTIGDITGDFINNSGYDGGAIYNEENGTIGDITGDFINNSGYDGGAIFNMGTLCDITGDFINNSGHYGGAIYNYYSTLGDITGDFIANYSSYDGGAIYNYYSTLGDITGDFIGNSSGHDGGAIYNRENGTISNITGDFIGNFSGNYGGAIYNSGTLSDIIGDFIGNFGRSGGAIENYGTISDIIGDFIGNSSSSNGGAIYNSGTFSDITGDFIGNSSGHVGGAIYNYGTIGNITGDFIGNSSGHVGGAIDNTGTIGDITGDFINNSGHYGGAIYNSGTLSDIIGDFIGNSSGDSGGAIYNYYSTLGDITGDFIGNSSRGNGGAIYNNGTIGNITGDFIDNSSSSNGGAIYNTGTIGNISGNFINNHAENSTESLSGGAISFIGAPVGNITNITGNFTGNYAKTLSGNASGGAVYMKGTSGTTGTTSKIFLDNITGNFEKNSAIGDIAQGGALYNGIEINEIKGNFINNSANGINGAQGGAIYNSEYYNGYGGALFKGEFNNLVSDFISNSAITENGSALGGAIYNGGAIGFGYDVPNDKIIKVTLTKTTIENVETGEKIEYYNPIYSMDAIKDDIKNGYKLIVSVDETKYRYPQNIFESEVEYVESLVEEIGYTYNNPFDQFSDDNFAKEQNNGLVNLSFYNNYAKSENGTAHGGAIYSTNDLYITAKDGGKSVFSGNYTEANGVKTPNAIYLDTTPIITDPNTGADRINIIDINTKTLTTQEIVETSVPDLTLKAETNGVIQFDDTIDGTTGNTQTITTTGDLVADEYYIWYAPTIEEFLENIKNDPPYWADDNWENMSDEEILRSAYMHGYLNTTNEHSETITESYGYSLKITGDETGKVILNNDVTAHTYDEDGKETGAAPANISLEKTNLYLGARDDIFDGNNLELKSGSMSMINDNAGVSALNNFAITGDTNFTADVDLANKEMDRFTADSYGEHQGNLNVIGLNLLSDANMDAQNRA